MDMATSKRIIWLGFNLSLSMTEILSEKREKERGNLEFDKITLEKLKDISLSEDIYAYYSQNDLKMVSKLKDKGIKFIQSKDRIQLDPEREDILYAVRIKNYNAFERQDEEIPDYARFEVFEIKSKLVKKDEEVA